MGSSPSLALSRGVCSSCGSTASNSTCSAASVLAHSPWVSLDPQVLSRDSQFAMATFANATLGCAIQDPMSSKTSPSSGLIVVKYWQNNATRPCIAAGHVVFSHSAGLAPFIPTAAELLDIDPLSLPLSLLDGVVARTRRGGLAVTAAAAEPAPPDPAAAAPGVGLGPVGG